MERKLATVRKIAEIAAIPEADKICAFRVDGWWVVDAVGKYSVGDLVIYIEPDAWVPTELAPFLSKGKEPREYNGVKGEKLRTIKLRGTRSQGLLLPLSTHAQVEDANESNVGMDVTEVLNIQKWEAPISAQLAGQARGNFPSRIIKTDQERIQNLTREFVTGSIQQYTYEVQEKCEGSSCTIYLLDGEFGVCSRNIDLKETEGNTFWEAARAYNVEEIIRSLGYDVALQFELIGPGIQQNWYKLQKHELRLFDVQLLNEGGRYMTPEERYKFAKTFKLKEAPLIHSALDISYLSQAQLLEMADGKSMIGTSNVNREGLVFKANNEKRFSFKAISNLFLEKQKD